MICWFLPFAQNSCSTFSLLVGALFDVVACFVSMPQCQGFVDMEIAFCQVQLPCPMSSLLHTTPAFAQQLEPNDVVFTLSVPSVVADVLLVCAPLIEFVLGGTLDLN